MKVLVCGLLVEYCFTMFSNVPYKSDWVLNGLSRSNLNSKIGIGSDCDQKILKNNTDNGDHSISVAVTVARHRHFRPGPGS